MEILLFITGSVFPALLFLLAGVCTWFNSNEEEIRFFYLPNDTFMWEGFFGGLLLAETYMLFKAGATMMLYGHLLVVIAVIAETIRLVLIEKKERGEFSK